MEKEKTKIEDKICTYNFTEIMSSGFSTNPFLYDNTNEYWSFGEANLFPQFLNKINRMSPINRKIINSKVNYTIGGGFNYKNSKFLDSFVNNCNIYNTHLKDELIKIVGDYILSGNAYIEIVTNKVKSFLYIYHHDCCTAREGKGQGYTGNILLHPVWNRYGSLRTITKKIARFPEFSEDEENKGILRSILHLKRYEPEFNHYGLCDWIPGIVPAGIDYKTLLWNYSLLVNSFQLSGQLVIDGQFKDAEDAQIYVDKVVNTFSGEGKQGKVAVMQIDSSKSTSGVDNQTKFTPFQTTHEGDWQTLKANAESSLIFAHNWFRGLAGINDNTGFDTNRLKNEYDVALPTVIQPLQNVFLETLYNIFKVIGVEEELQFINNSPNQEVNDVMRLWEARKNLGLQYDELAPDQQDYLFNLLKKPVTK